MERLGRVTSIALIYIGTVVGAGFASGQETWFFFSRFQEKGLWGILISLVLLGVLGAKAMEWGRRKGVQSYPDFLTALVGPFYGKFCDLVMTIFLFILTGVMLAGSGAVTVELGWGRALGCWLTVILTVLVLSRRLSGLKGVNLLIVPLLFLTGLVLNLYGKHVLPPEGPPFASPGSWMVSAFQYSAYNLVMSLPVLVNLYQLEPEPSVLRWGGWTGGFALGVLALLLHLVLRRYNFSTIDLPLLFLTQKWSRWWRYLYSFVLWGELFTTLVAHAYGLSSRFKLVSSKAGLVKLSGLLALAVLVSRIGFARLITRFYPLFGLVSLTILLPLALRPLPSVRKEEEIYRKKGIFDRREVDME
ncbi:MAG: hypothetical protein GX050_07265 [Firmicutes bacterium]|nr:hypothetical protein [Bacillota bacterium]